MKIIDAHLHLNKNEKFDQLGEQGGPKNDLSSLLREFERFEVAGCVVMGTGRLDEDPCRAGLFNLAGEPDPDHYRYPPQVCFCIGVDPEGLKPGRLERTLADYRRVLACPNCMGFKIYLGYKPYFAYDPIYTPVYELAREFDLTVAYHTGDTASSTGRLRFAHPLAIDEVAVAYPKLRLVICHFGSPWMADAAEVVAKNPNVYTDLSGLAVGRPETADFRGRFSHYVSELSGWLAFAEKWDRVMFGTDWPLVSLEHYIALIASCVPAAHWEQVFYRSALSAYPKLGKILE